MWKNILLCFLHIRVCFNTWRLLGLSSQYCVCQSVSHLHTFCVFSLFLLVYYFPSFVSMFKMILIHYQSSEVSLQKSQSDYKIRSVLSFLNLRGADDKSQISPVFISSPAHLNILLKHFNSRWCFFELEVWMLWYDVKSLSGWSLVFY